MTPYFQARRPTMATGPDVKETLVGYLKELHLPAFRQGYEELARQAQQESLSYERYLPGLAERECQERRGHLGYVQQSREEMEVLFTLLAERYERGSVLLTSNLPFSGWEAIFKDAMTTAAAIGRLVHHAVIIELNLPSYRAEQAKKAKQG